MRNAQTLISANSERLTFDTSIKEVVKKRGNAFVQCMHEGKSTEDTIRSIRSVISDFTGNGDTPADIVISGFDYEPEIIDIIEKMNSKLIWAC